VILADVNVLVYAFRPEVEHHETCRRWLRGVIEGDEPFAASSAVMSAIIRVTTTPRFYPNPSSLKTAFGFCEDLLRQPHCRIVEPGDRHWEIFERLCMETNTRGGRVTDAWFAALAIESGCEWITMDRDFARFPGLRWRLPELPPTAT
jgi:hypothetical protein